MLVKDEIEAKVVFLLLSETKYPIQKKTEETKALSGVQTWNWTQSG